MYIYSPVFVLFILSIFVTISKHLLISLSVLYKIEVPPKIMGNLYKFQMEIQMNFTIAVCDDNQEDGSYIASAINEWAKEENHSVHIDVFPSGESLLFQYEDTKYQILLLDIEMGGMSGLEVARRVRGEEGRAEIIFITSHFEFSGEGYEVDALHYLVKPVSREKLKAVLTKAAQRLSLAPPSLVIVCNNETIKLYESDILYIESFLHYISIHTASCEYRIKANISAFKERLSDDFYQIHRSYLASLKHIVKISRTAVWMDNGIQLPLARGKYDSVNLAFIKQN